MSIWVNCRIKQKKTSENSLSNLLKENIKKVKTNCPKIFYVLTMNVTVNTVQELPSTIIFVKDTQKRTSEALISFERVSQSEII